MTNKQKHFFNIAREISFLSDFKRARVGAVVVEKNRVISTGHNANKTSTLQGQYNLKRGISSSYPARIHAEMAALKPLLNPFVTTDFSHSSIYVYREKKDGGRSCARPCEACMALIKQLGIKTIYYTDWDGSYIKEIVL